jgi:uncharacterized protein (DUF1778 family)
MKATKKTKSAKQYKYLLKLSPSDGCLIKKAAAMRRMSIRAFISSSCVAIARKVLAADPVPPPLEEFISAEDAA